MLAILMGITNICIFRKLNTGHYFSATFYVSGSILLFPQAFLSSLKNTKWTSNTTTQIFFKI